MTHRYLFTVGETAIAAQKKISNRLKTILQSLISMETVETPEWLTDSIKGISHITIGKCCLEDESLAKECIPMWVKQLDSEASMVIRNNILIVLCDLCIKYVFFSS